MLAITLARYTAAVTTDRRMTFVAWAATVLVLAAVPWTAAAAAIGAARHTRTATPTG